MKDQTANQSETATFECKIDIGEPKSKVKFFKDGRELSESNKYTIITVEETITLKVNNIELKDQGTYKVEALNKLGKVESSCSLTVFCKQSIFIL